MQILVVSQLINQSIVSFKNSQASDPLSAFGGIVACNFKINKSIATRDK